MKVQKYLYEFTGTIMTKGTKEEPPVPLVETFFVVAATPEDGLVKLQESNPKVNDFVRTSRAAMPCNKDW